MRYGLKKWSIGDKVQDEDGHIGIVSIVWDDGDICTIENDAAHPNPKKSDIAFRYQMEND